MQYSPEILEQVAWLEKAVNNRLCELKNALLELDVMERDLKEFLSYYYAQVGRYFADLEKLEYQIGTLLKGRKPILYKKPANTAARSHDEGEVSLERDVYEKEKKKAADKEMKHIYRKLAKQCHPDMQQDEKRQEWFILLNSAYTRQDFSTLVRLEQMFLDRSDFANETMVQKLERLEKKHDSILKILDEIKMKKHAIRQSSQFKLRAKVHWEQQYAGRDLMEQIKIRIRRKLYARQKELLALQSEILLEMGYCS